MIVKVLHLKVFRDWSVREADVQSLDVLSLPDVSPGVVGHFWKLLRNIRIWSQRHVLNGIQLEVFLWHSNARHFSLAWFYHATYKKINNNNKKWSFTYHRDPEGNVRLVEAHCKEERTLWIFHRFEQSYGLCCVLQVRQSSQRHLRDIHRAQQVTVKPAVFVLANLKVESGGVVKLRRENWDVNVTCILQNILEVMRFIVGEWMKDCCRMHQNTFDLMGNDQMARHYRTIL